MLRNFILVILAAIAISACSQSLLKEGIYTDIGGSEKLISINLLVSGEFILNHETWQPGHYEDRQSVVTKGEWVFNNKNLMLNIDNQTYIADLVTIGKNPSRCRRKYQGVTFSQ